MTVIDKAMLAVAITTMLIGAGQLAIMLASANPKRARLTSSWPVSRRVLSSMSLILLVVGFGSAIAFLVDDAPPTRGDIVMLGLSFFMALEGVLMAAAISLRTMMRLILLDLRRTESRLLTTIGLHSHR